MDKRAHWLEKHLCREELEAVCDDNGVGRLDEKVGARL